jgi:hypothetical protein
MSIHRLFAVGILVVFGFIFLGCVQPIDQPTTQLAEATNSPTPTISVSLTPTIRPTVTRRPTKTLRPTRTLRPTYTSTLTLTPTVTLTSTPVPALVAHIWNPLAVLISYDAQGGDGCCEYPIPPLIMLYSDGRFFTTQHVQTENDFRAQILTSQLSRQQICQLLNTVDQSGIFDYDPTSYRYEPFGGEPQEIVRINAWRSKEFSHYGLFRLTMPGGLEEYETVCPNCGYLDVAVANVYKLIRNYQPAGLQVYEPDRLAIWVSGKSKINSRFLQTWPLTSPTLADLYEQTNDSFRNPKGIGMVLRGDSAKLVYQSFKQSIPYGGEGFTDGKFQYGVFARPLLPYETPPSLYGRNSEIPAPEFPEPDYQLSCSPEDGVLEIP